jgi:uncharacterized membrane protein YsdA (DUF1294 family)
LPIIANIMLALVGINIVTIGLFWLDKQAAIKGQSRIAEKTLLLFALMGGTPGAFYAQQRFRHKTQKEPFRSILKLIAGLQMVVIVAAIAFPAHVIGFIKGLSI